MLVSRGHEVTALILYFGSHSPATDYLKERGVNVVASPWLGTTPAHLRWYLSNLQSIRPDVFVPNISTAGWLAARWCREAGVPTVSACRGNDEYHSAMVDQFILGPEKWAVSGCVFVSQYLQQQVASRSPKNTQLRVIPSGVPVPSRQAQAAGDKFSVVYVGRLEERHKRISDTVGAMIALAKADSRIEAAIIGDGSRRSHVCELIDQAGLQTRIRVLGPIAADRLHSELIRHQALILLSDSEGLPGAVMDGMACGLVPVVTNTDGIQELVVPDETGLIVHDRNDSFVAAVGRLASDDNLWRQLSSSARRKIEAGYSLHKAADAWEQFLAELISSAGPKRSISVPHRFELPPVHPDLAREDERNWVRYRLITALGKIKTYLLSFRSIGSSIQS